VGQVALRGVSKHFGTVEAVRDFDLEVEDQEFLVLLGPSGCGKSTVLRIIAGLEDPDRGTVVIGDRAVNDVEPKDRDIAMVFQNYALYPHMTVGRNIDFPLKCRGMPKPERAGLVASAAEALGLTTLLDRRPAQLSGGQRQRVALARAIVRRPQVFLMDEPLSNLDAKLRVQTRTELIELQRRLTTTFVYVTHDQIEGMTMADRLAVMNEGALEQVAPPAEVYAHPASLFVARFIGSPPMNTVTGTPARLDGELGIGTSGGQIPLSPAQRQAVEASAATTIAVGMRPERLTIGTTGPLPATVAVVESLGAEHHVICRLTDDQEVIVRIGTDAAVPDEGAAVRLDFGVEHLHLFDATTGDRIGR
jgi:multiple sugar transport system ATP-binding protein